MIKIIDDIKFMPDMKKSIHYISWTPCHDMSVSGYASLSFVYAIVYTNLPDLNTDKLFREVDMSDEVCTLYPRANITIIPTHRGAYSDEEIYRHFHDAMKAQHTYINVDNIIFDMRYYCYYNPHTKSYDNLEYLNMLDYNLKLYKNVYVIYTGNEKNGFELASKEEIDALRLQRK